MPAITITANELVKGESFADDFGSAGFSPRSRNINLVKTKGKLYFSPTATSLNTNLVGNVIASCNDNNYLGNEKYILDDTGRFYTLNGTTLTVRQTCPSGATFQLGTSDIIQFNSKTYATSLTGLYEIVGSNLETSINQNSTLTTAYRHPIERVEDEIFIADVNQIIYLNTAGATGIAFTLPVGVNITSLRKHPDGKTLLAFCGLSADFSHTRPQAGMVYYCDPILRDWTKEQQISAQVEGTKNIGGTVYASWGKNIGYYDGSGLQKLKEVADATTYSHNMNGIEDGLLTRDDDEVLMYSDLGVGRVWHRPYIASNTINHITYYGNNQILIADNARSLDLLNLGNSATTSGSSFYTNKYIPETTVNIYRVDIWHDATSAGTTTTWNLSAVDDNGTSNQFYNESITGYATAFTRINCDITSNVIQLLIQFSAGAVGIKAIKIYYEPVA